MNKRPLRKMLAPQKPLRPQTTKAMDMVKLAMRKIQTMPGFSQGCQATAML
eukprot:CAMPEP_0177185672 /NCGR_PEP_ID=MMETSP0367-20130122/18229_1 /TAXON_ID=447022 ORGANISM="Scrippsiella hangoei-like, Strain SHHI-4" /NCGR_SAMPLE_ID=MMETSP0367 /ASSEMBLY_ACC=CAM_ASM_000362 /LENGTH=50 /DNA_ID=CAMNT_0018632897 /DNA_START=77 /DNA_END=226 /DNA_ORIENTATION=+